MSAVIQTGGKQYRAAPGMELQVEKLPGQVGATVTFDRVLMTSDGETVEVGKPYLESIKVSGKITRQDKNKKIVVFKFKRRKGDRNKRGHRQAYTRVVIDSIGAS